MSSFLPIISSKPYKGGIFARPPAILPGRAVLLRSSKTNNIVEVTQSLTPRDISLGKFDEQIEIDISHKSINFPLILPSLNEPYLFDVKLTVRIKVVNPLTFYVQSYSDISKIISENIIADVRKVTREYSVIEYKGIEEIVLSKISGKYGEEIDGIEYNIKFVECTPNANARGYIERIAKAKLNEETVKQEHRSATNIEKDKLDNAKELTYTTSLEDAIFAEVISGEISSAEAIGKLFTSKQNMGREKLQNFDYIIGFINKLKDSDLMSDEEARNRITNILNDNLTLPEGSSKNDDSDDFPNSDDILENMEESEEKEYEEAVK